jgi:hypothetical protein
VLKYLLWPPEIMRLVAFGVASKILAFEIGSDLVAGRQLSETTLENYDLVIAVIP